MPYQTITLTLIANEEDVEGIKRELSNSLEILSEEYIIHHEQITEDDAEDPRDLDDRYDFEDAR